MPVPSDRVLVTNYFETAVLTFNCGDIEALLKNLPKNERTQQPATGALFASVMSGIDTLGGMLYGFKGDQNQNNSSIRSPEFMKTYMSMTDEEAKRIYDLGRCGMLHQSAPKSGMGIRADFSIPANDGELFHRSGRPGDDTPTLEVVELARRYLKAVRIIDSQRQQLFYLPDLPKVPFSKEFLDGLKIYDGATTTSAPITY
jgi:hypothetical protein